MSDNVFSVDPVEIARTIFSKPPEKKLCYQIIPNDENLDIYSAYEILITILMEGMNIFTDGLNTISSYDVENDHILAFDPWFYSLGINIKCETVDKKNTEQYDDYYCKIIIKDSLWKLFFEEKNIKKNYHFFLSSKFVQNKLKYDNIKDLYSIFISNDKVYKIRFDFIQIDLTK
jgi:hypothetical protein